MSKRLVQSAQRLQGNRVSIRCFNALIGILAILAPLAANAEQVDDPSRGTVGWFESGTGTVGITEGQTLRLSVVNLGPFEAKVFCGLWANPNLTQDTFSLQPGKSKDCDLKAADIPKEHFDKTGRAQIRAFVRSSARTVYGNVEVFDNQTGRTSIILPLREFGRRE